MSVAFFWLGATRSAGFMSQIRLLVSDTVDITMEYGITTAVVRFTASRAEKVTHATSVSFLERIGLMVTAPIRSPTSAVRSIPPLRSEERRVGKECRSGCAAYP